MKIDRDLQDLVAVVVIVVIMVTLIGFFIMTCDVQFIFKS